MPHAVHTGPQLVAFVMSAAAAIGGHASVLSVMTECCLNTCLTDVTSFYTSDHQGPVA